ncbi:MAG: HAD-IA family hydrolase [Candidatus Aminicenantes bacterium]|nr:HAD-IA family hydrolase [Candidatus Aminicenantes bacterium]
MIDTIISDMGQVVLHFNNRLFFRKMTQYTNRSEEEIRAVTHAHIEIVDLFDKGKIRPEEFYQKAKTGLEAEVSYEDFFAAYCDVFAVNPLTLGILKKLKPKYKLILLSNTDIVRFSYIKRKFPELLIFDGYVLSFDSGLMKPDPRVYIAALELAGSNPERAVFIDDIQENIDGAERVGIKGLLFTPEIDLEKALRDLGIEP